MSLENETLTSQETGTTEPQTTQPTQETGSETRLETEVTTLLTEEDKKPEAKPAGAPEKYEPFKAPVSWEEKGLELDPKTLEAATPLFKELGLSQEQAQKLIDFYTGVAEANSDAAMQLVADQRKEWREAVSADKQVGHRLAEVKTNFTTMLNTLGDAKLIADFKEAMNLTGAGDHPAFIRAVDLWSTRFIEGKHVQGNGPTTEGQKSPGAKPDSAARALYPNNP